jgi:hypothetical protein
MPELERTKSIGKLWRSHFLVVRRVRLQSHVGCHLPKRSLDLVRVVPRSACRREFLQISVRIAESENGQSLVIGSVFENLVLSNHSTKINE